MRKIYSKILFRRGEYITRVSFMSFPFLLIASFCREKGHYFFNFSVLLKFFRVITWKRNFSRQDPSLHLEHTVEARSTENQHIRPHCTETSGRPTERKCGPSEWQCSKALLSLLPCWPQHNHSAVGRTLTVVGLMDLPI